MYIVEIIVLSLFQFVYTQNIIEDNIVDDKRDGLMHLFNISYIKEKTLNYDHYRVTLKETNNKGIGVFATRPIKEGRTILYYKLMVYDNTDYDSPFDRKYNFRVYDEEGYYISHLTSDLYVESLQISKGNKPFWGYFVNEPNKDQMENVEVDVDLEENYRNRDYIEPGDVIIYKFVTKRDIEPGEEITWCYGSNYQRDYETSCNEETEDNEDSENADD